MKAFYERFKAKYGITSDLSAVLIFIVFGITGSASVYVAKPVLEFFKVSKETMSPWVYWPLRILIIFPIYQVLLTLIGALFGQFGFFWQFQKKMVGPMGRLFGFNPNKQAQP